MTQDLPYHPPFWNLVPKEKPKDGGAPQNLLEGLLVHISKDIEVIEGDIDQFDDQSVKKKSCDPFPPIASQSQMSLLQLSYFVVHLFQNLLYGLILRK